MELNNFEVNWILSPDNTTLKSVSSYAMVTFGMKSISRKVQFLLVAHVSTSHDLCVREKVLSAQCYKIQASG